ncbi:energy transducer TonB [Dokdonella sp.]|uniref:energy transducer TonB n=1 Tax=Dokdonella sp. TaxID=2291710 RepID=UPI001B1B4D49|nr:energy transducer TonB [Dokdonella sp.]MBO9664884.1 energy transducer TonB [Dokdonella sp.]
MRGAVSAVQLVLILIVLAAFAAAAWWWYVGQRGVSALAPTTAPGATTAPAAGEAPPLPTAELSVNELYKAARGAMAENRMVTPPGNNALEFYLAIMTRQPDDNGAVDAVRELFPFATGSAEDQINQGNYDEATRIMSLLAQADPSNYSLTILRSKLDAKRKQVERDQQLQAQQAAAAATRTQTAATPAAPAAATPDAAAPTAAAPAPAASTAAASRPTEVARATPPPSAAPPAAPAPAPVGETRDARMTTVPQPEYPATAARNRQSGWVEVEFTVAADGSVQNARAVSSSPPRVFDREAVRAIQQAKFEPRLDRGQPVATTLRRRIEFKLGN